MNAGGKTAVSLVVAGGGRAELLRLSKGVLEIAGQQDAIFSLQRR